MRIVMLNARLPSTSKSGVGHQVARLSQILVQRGHQVVVRSLSPAPTPSDYGVDLLWSPRYIKDSKMWELGFVPVAFATGSYKSYDVIHAHGDNPLLYRRHTPVVRTFYGAAREEARTADRFRRRAAQTLLVAAESMGRVLATVTVGISDNTSRSHGGLDLVIPCGVDRNLFRPRTKSEVPSILYVGTLRGRKRGGRVVEMFKNIIQPRFPNAELWFVADCEIREKGIKSFGVVSDDQLAFLFGTAWVFTLPSTYEGFGVPYIEAMASGTPVVATPNEGASELVGPDTGGVLAHDDDLGEVISMLLLDESKRINLGKRGRQASANFEWDSIAARYEKVYETAVQSKRRHS